MNQNEDKRKEQMEQDACGIGAIVRMDGEREHVLVEQALTIVEQLEHRAGKDASGEIGAVSYTHLTLPTILLV